MDDSVSNRASPANAFKRPKRRTVQWLAVAVAAIAVLAVGFPYAASKLGYVQSGISPYAIPIKHIVVLMMENRAFDNLFGDYCQQKVPACPMTVNGIPPGDCVPYFPSNPAAGCIRPFPLANTSTPNMPHVYNTTILSIDNGAMDGFYRAERNNTEPFGYYNGSILPVYWDIAQEFGLGDNYFSSALSYSLPNHWYLLAGQFPKNGFNGSDLTSVTKREVYLNSANNTTSVQDRLNQTPGVTWKYYDWALVQYQTAISAVPISGGYYPAGAAYNYLNPLAAKYESYTGGQVAHFVPRSTFFQDVANGTLPDISWIIPGPTFSDHPPANLKLGEQFVASVINAIGASSEWKSTAIFVSWDDYGGFYDHVPPPNFDPYGLSIRVPLIVISPYTPKGLVVSSLEFHESLLHFIEWRFGLGCITIRDCTAPLPLQYFNFDANPRPPILFPTNASSAIYPMFSPLVATDSPSAASLVGPYCAPYCIDPSIWDTGPPDPSMPQTEVD